MEAPGTSPTPARQTCFPHCLPESALHHIVLRLRDPAALALTCRATAALLNEDDILLDWAAAWSPRLAVHTPSDQLRHPFYALLHWRRLRCMSTKRLATLLLRRPRPGCALTLSDAEPKLNAGGGLNIIRALLPHSQQLLLMYAAQAGQTRLLGELLACPAAHCPVKLTWAGRTAVEDQYPLQLALKAAVRSGQMAAMRLLLPAVKARQGSVPYSSLIQTAAAGGPHSTGALQELLRLSYDCPNVWASSIHVAQLAAVTAGDAVACAALAGSGGPGNIFHQCCVRALRCGHIHLLPLLQQADTDIDDEQAASYICSFAGICAPHAAQQLQLQVLPHAMWRIRGSSSVQSPWGKALQAMLASNNVAALQAVWSRLTDPADRAVLAKCMLSALPSAQHADVAGWVLANARPALRNTEGATAADATMQQAALAALTQGRCELLHVLLAPEAVAALISADDEWQLADVMSKVCSAARSGDSEALRDALTGVQTYTNEHAGTITQQHAHRIYDEALDNALMAGLRSHNPATAAAVVTALAREFGEDTSMLEWLAEQDLLMVHDGRTARVLLERWPAVREYAAGPASIAWFCEQALEAGDMELASWLVAQPEQRPDYLEGIEWSDRYKDPMPGNKPVDGFIRLLHRLATMAKETASSNRGCNDSSSKVDSDTAGSSKVYGGIDASRALPPAGARVLSDAFFSDILSEGNPDLLYALLVCLDSWQGCTSQ